MTKVREQKEERQEDRDREEEGGRFEDLRPPSHQLQWEIDFFCSAGVGKSCVIHIRPNPSPALDKTLASMGPGILSSTGVGVWKKAPEAFPDSNTTLDTFQSAMQEWDRNQK